MSPLNRGMVRHVRPAGPANTAVPDNRADAAASKDARMASDVLKNYWPLAERFFGDAAYDLRTRSTRLGSLI